MKIPHSRNGLLACAASLLWAAQAAHADLVVIVSARSTTDSLSADEIAQIYLGRSPMLQPLDNGPERTALRTRFYAKVTNKDESQIKAIWSRLVFTGRSSPPQVFASDAEVVKAVAAGSRMIGYVDKSAVDASVKVVYEVR